MSDRQLVNSVRYLMLLCALVILFYSVAVLQRVWDESVWAQKRLVGEVLMSAEQSR